MQPNEASSPQSCNVSPILLRRSHASAFRSEGDVQLELRSKVLRSLEKMGELGETTAIFIL
jgi:hypothetical protein